MPFTIFHVLERFSENPQNCQNFQIGRRASASFDPAHNQRVAIPSGSLEATAKIRLVNPWSISSSAQLG